MIWSRKKFNSRHKTIIGILIFIALALQTLPLMLVFCEDKEIEHGTCVLELPVNKTCTEGGSNNVYILSKNGKHANLLISDKHINSCEQYNDVVITEHPLSTYFAFDICAIIIIFADIVLAFIGLVYFIIWLFNGED